MSGNFHRLLHRGQVKYACKTQITLSVTLGLTVGVEQVLK
jgi:hypothetical protein